MESQAALLSAPTQQPQPVIRADSRPTADAAALARSSIPDIPLPVPASMTPVAEVNKSRMPQTMADAVTPVERTLKPYGVSMLPHGPTDRTDTP
ncbi:hypothetical protein [Yoonia sp. 208BN28-4]|uniref:hypothetical protein n=1 Tax=Yoonia sp. 208BN28-4 TaxID=3126505 RepID=UPI003097BB47